MGVWFVRITCGSSIAARVNTITTRQSAWPRLKCASKATRSSCRFRSVPELPEVETVARSIAPLVGRRIVTAEFRNLRVLRGGDPENLTSQLQGRRITGVKRYGKY